MQTSDCDWELLLLYLRHQRIVPIIGRDLITVQVDGKETTLDHFLAGRLAQEFGLPLNESSGDLSHVALRCIQTRRTAGHVIYSKLQAILEREKIATPEPLRQLAEIVPFKLFVSTTFDSLLRQALNDVRFAGRDVTHTLSYSPWAPVQDLPANRSDSNPVVYNIFGKASLFPDYAVTEEDTLEFLHALQADNRRPHHLFEVLRDYHLLFLGCGFPDWLARFFIRTMTNERFQVTRNKTEIVSDDSVHSDSGLVLFLEHFKTQVLPFGPARFVDELHRQWTASMAPSVRPARPAPVPVIRKMPDDAIFLSFASEDRDRVRLIRDRLVEAGLEVWFDEDRLRAGVDLEAEIRDRICRCSLFVPFLSQRAEHIREAHFREEWHWACKRLIRTFATSAPFIIPAALDGTGVDAPNIPNEFQKPFWGRVDTEESIAKFVDDVRSAYRRLAAPQYG